MKSAVLIDGAFLLRCFPRVFPDKAAGDPAAVAKAIFSMAVDHVRKAKGDKEALYRIFYYDCPPLTKKHQLPISGRTIDFSKSSQAVFRSRLHEQLRRQRKVALRLGRLSDFADWQLKPDALSRLRRKELLWEQLTDDHFHLGIRQKAVDMKIGLDIASLAYKRLVDQIILVAGDADFVPAAKLARREGIDFILDPLWTQISGDLFEHIDGMQSVCAKPGAQSDHAAGST